MFPEATNYESLEPELNPSETLNPMVDPISFDLDQDGIYDSLAYSVQTNEDTQLWMIETDTDADGISDQFHTLEAADLDNDGQHDAWLLNTDVDGDGLLDFTALVEAMPVEETPTIDVANSSDPMPTMCEVVGDPESCLPHWHQQTNPDTCAIVSQEFILDQMTGKDFTEEELRQMAIEKGWYTPGGGTPLDAMGNLLEANGIDVEKQYGCTLDHINQQLAQGNHVMVAIDSGEVWNPETDEDDALAMYNGIPENGVDHAVQVIGVDYSDANHPVVILNDPGSPDGQGMRVPADQFLDAWQDSNSYMVSTTGQVV